MLRLSRIAYEVVCLQLKSIQDDSLNAPAIQYFQFSIAATTPPKKTKEELRKESRKRKHTLH